MSDYDLIRNVLAPLNPEFTEHADDKKFHKFISIGPGGEMKQENGEVWKVDKPVHFGFSAEGKLEVVEVFADFPHTALLRAS